MEHHNVCNEYKNGSFYNFNPNLPKVSIIHKMTLLEMSNF